VLTTSPDKWQEGKTIGVDIVKHGAKSSEQGARTNKTVIRQDWWSRKKSLKSSPRRKPGSRTPWYSWIPAFAGMTEKRGFWLFTKPSRLTYS